MDKNKKLFPQRLWELIHDEKYNFCLRWSPDGQRVYLNRNEFEAHYLKTPNNQFHTQKAISFVRQMNMYGFRKVDDCYYENDNFKRDCQHLLKNMVRRHSSKCYLTNFTGDLSGAVAAHALNAANVAHLHHHHQHHQHQQQHQHQHQQQQQHHHQAAHERHQPITRGPRMTSPSHHHHHQRHNHHQPSAGAQLSDNSNLDNSIGSLSAALMAISSNNQNAFRGTQQASSLYHRLAALNFGGQTNGQTPPATAAIANQQRQTATLMIVPCDQLQQHHNQSHNNNQNQQQQDFNQASLLLNQAQQDNNNYNGLDIPMGVQESMTIRQALQNNLFRTFLQLNKQLPTAPILPQQQQHQQQQQQQQLNPNLLLESLANLTRANLVAQVARETANRMSTTSPEASLNMLVDQAPLGALINRNATFDPMNMDDDNFSIDYEEDDMPGSGGSGSGGGSGIQYSSSSASSNNEPARYQQDQFLEDTVLDLAKPSNTRSRNVSPRG